MYTVAHQKTPHAMLVALAVSDVEIPYGVEDPRWAVDRRCSLVREWVSDQPPHLSRLENRTMLGKDNRKRSWRLSEKT